MGIGALLFAGKFTTECKSEALIWRPNAGTPSNSCRLSDLFPWGRAETELLY